MKRVVLRVYAFIIFLVLFAAISHFVVALAQDFNNNQETARQSFLRFAHAVRTLCVNDPEAFLTQQTTRQLASSHIPRESLSAFTIDSADKTLFYWSSEPHLISMNTGSKQVEVQSPQFFKTFRTTFTHPAIPTPIIITASSLLLPPQLILLRLKPIMFIALSIFLLTILLLVITALYDTEQQQYQRAYESDPANSDFSPPPLTTHTDREQNAPRSTVQESPAPPHEPIPAAAAENQQPYTNNTGIPENGYIPHTHNTEMPPPAEPQETSSFHPDTHDPYSPPTVLGREDYFLIRLDAELKRAAANINELSLMLISVGNTTGQPLCEKLIERLLQSCPVKDLLFTLKNHTFALILPEIPFDEAMKIAEELYSDLQAIRADHNQSKKIAIGISTRAARIVPVSTLFHETSGALRKAQAGTEPIIAFFPSRQSVHTFRQEQS